MVGGVVDAVVWGNERFYVKLDDAEAFHGP